MNIFLVGNGFDLHHKFPTRYIDFLHTMGFLIQNKDETYTTIGKIFGNADLQQKKLIHSRVLRATSTHI